MNALKTRSSLADFVANAPCQESWEVGGNCNFLIAASRIGLRCACVGHVGHDKYGAFLTKVLAEENITFHPLISYDNPTRAGSESQRTLLCFVLTDGAGKHAFCSRYDLGPWPLLGGNTEMDPAVSRAISNSSSIFFNGFIFDELEDAAVRAALNSAKENSTAVFFDPGPRANTFLKDSERGEALRNILAKTNVLLATLDEATVLVNVYLRQERQDHFDDNSDDKAKLMTMSSKAKFVARALLESPSCGAEWVVIKCGPVGAVIFTKDGYEVRVGSPVVPVRDTVGCGDSAAAAIVLGYLNFDRARRQAKGDKGLQGVSDETIHNMLEETLTLATTIGAATAMGDGAGRNVATADAVRALLSRFGECEGKKHVARGFGIDTDAAARAKNMLEASLKNSLL